MFEGHGGDNTPRALTPVTSQPPGMLSNSDFGQVIDMKGDPGASSLEKLDDCKQWSPPCLARCPKEMWANRRTQATLLNIPPNLCQDKCVKTPPPVIVATVP
jgi:hypothetical protein